MEHAVADVGGERGAPHGGDLEAQRWDAVEEAFARADGDRRDVRADLVDETGGEVLVDRGGSAGDGDVALSGGLAGLIEGRPDPVGHEGERRAALHRQRLAQVVGEYEHTCGGRRGFTPPTLPAVGPYR